MGRFLVTEGCRGVGCAGNRDLPAAGRAAAALKSHLGPLPEPYRSFYVRRAAAEVLGTAGGSA